MRIHWLALLLPLAACSAGNEPSQAVARVNGQEISVHQFNHVTRLAGAAGTSEEVRRELSGKLVDRELAIQQALALKLDRQPDLMFRLEEARRDVLARAYAEHIAGARTPPTREDAAKYFAEHPELFAKRRVFRLHELALPAGMKDLAAAKERLAASKSFDEFLGWLKQRNAQFGTQFTIRAAEELPIEVVARLNATPEGGAAVFESTRGITVYRVLSAQDAPVTWEQAAPLILAHLARQDGKQALDAEMLRLRKTGKIEYYGEFSQLLQPGASG